jgi:hypothetical protein
VGVHVMVESAVERVEGALVVALEPYGDVSSDQAWIL